VKKLVAKVLGVTDERPFPKFTRRRAKALTAETQRHGERIIFLSDPFARYIEPDVEQAAFDVLAACGYEVQVLPILGAGASLLSKGFIEAARLHAGKILDALNQLDPQCEAAIVGIEPPEIYCLKNDYADLLPVRRDEIASRSAQTWLLDEYLLRSDGFSNLRVGRRVEEDQVSDVTETEGVDATALRLRSVSIRSATRPSAPLSAEKVLFQPHCHQRAEGLAPDGLPSGAGATVALLRSCGYEVELLDTGCCGMAGTFGYEAEHYALSQQVGELKLFPILRSLNREGAKNAKKDQRLVEVGATGAACRMQIVQGTGVDAVHPIVLVREALLAS
jgi:Fe-S oxidoreductase